MKKKYNILILLLICIFAMNTTLVKADMKDGTVKVMVNGSELVTDTKAVIRNSRTMVPFRAIFEALGANEILWDAPTQTVLAKSDDKTIMLTIGSFDMIVNDQTITMDTPPMIINSRTMIPLSMVSKHMGADVAWDGKNYIAGVTSNSSNSNGNIFIPVETNNPNPIIQPPTPPSNTDTSGNKALVSLNGYFAMQDISKNSYVLNLKSDGTLDIKNINSNQKATGTYKASNDSLSITSSLFNSNASRQDYKYNNKIMILLKEKSNSNIYAITQINRSQYDSYMK